MQKTKQSDEKIRDALRTFDRRRVTKTPGRDRSIRIRVTTQECDEIKNRVNRLNVSVSDLFRQLFLHAKEHL